MFKICISNNNKKRMHILLRILKEYGADKDIEISVVTNPEYELEHFVRNSVCDLYIIDPSRSYEGYDGIYLAERIKIISRSSLLVFIAAEYPQKDDLIRIINTEPFAYILDDTIEAALRKTLDKAMYLKLNEGGNFTYSKRNESCTIQLNTVIYFMSSHRVIRYVRVDGEEDYFYEKMDNIENAINQLSSDFIRVSQSYLINQKYVFSLNGNEITMLNNDIITISRKYHDALDTIKQMRRK